MQPTPPGVGDDLLYRVARAPDPVAFPSREYADGRNRYDDPRGEYRVLYAASSKLPCFLELLAGYRPSARVLAAERFLDGCDEPPDAPGVGPYPIPADWREKRRIGRLRVAPGQTWLDLTSFAVRQSTRASIAHILAEHGYEDLDVGVACGPDRDFTKALSRWAHERGYSGVVYPSRLESAYVCRAIFEGTAFERVGEVEEIEADDPELRSALSMLGLRLP